MKWLLVNYTNILISLNNWNNYLNWTESIDFIFPKFVDACNWIIDVSVNRRSDNLSHTLCKVLLKCNTTNQSLEEWVKKYKNNLYIKIF